MTKTISFVSHRTRISGFLDLPKQKPSAQMILIHGSGPETADSGNGYEGRDVEKFPVQIFKSLGKDLSHRGILVLRYDKRGVRKSGGDWLSVSRTDLLNDLLASIKFLQKQSSKLPLFLVGFSEGANLAISAALQNKKISGIILAGGAAEKLPKVVLAKTKKKAKYFHLSKSQTHVELKRLKTIFKELNKLNNFKRRKKIRKLWGVNPVEWWAERLRMRSPKMEAKNLKCPVFILHGKDDLEVLVDEAFKMDKVLMKNKIPHDIKILPHLNHFFARSNMKNPGSEYDKKFKISPQVPNLLVKWVKKTIPKQ